MANDIDDDEFEALAREQAVQDEADFGGAALTRTVTDKGVEETSGPYPSRLAGPARRPGLKLPHPEVRSPKFSPNGPETSQISAIINSLSDSTNLGFSDELVGGMSQVAGRDGSYDDYKKAAANSRALTEYDWPKTSAASEFAGYLAPFIPALKGAKAVVGGAKALAKEAMKAGGAAMKAGGPKAALKELAKPAAAPLLKEVAKTSGKAAVPGTVLGAGKSEEDTAMGVAGDALKSGAKTAGFTAAGLTAPFLTSLYGLKEGAEVVMDPEASEKDKWLAGGSSVAGVASGAAANRVAKHEGVKNRAVDLAQRKNSDDIVKRTLRAKDAERQAASAKERADASGKALSRAQAETPVRLSELMKRRDDKIIKLKKGQLDAALKDPEIAGLSPQGKYKSFVDYLNTEGQKAAGSGKRQQLLNRLEELKRSKQGRVGNFSQSDSQAADLIRKRFAAQGKQIPDDVAQWLDSAEANTENWAKDRAAAGPAQQRAEMEYLREVEALTNELASMDDGAGRRRVPADAVRDQWATAAEKYGIDVGPDPTAFDPFAQGYTPKLTDAEMMTYRGAAARKMQQLGLDPGNLNKLDPANPELRLLGKDEYFTMPSEDGTPPAPKGTPQGAEDKTGKVDINRLDENGVPKQPDVGRRRKFGLLENDPAAAEIAAQAKRSEARILAEQDRANQRHLKSLTSATSATERAAEMKRLVEALANKGTPEAILEQGAAELQGLRDARGLARSDGTYDRATKFGGILGMDQMSEGQLRNHGVRAARAAELQKSWSTIPGLQKYAPVLMEAVESGDEDHFENILNSLRRNPSAKSALEAAGL